MHKLERDSCTWERGAGAEAYLCGALQLLQLLRADLGKMELRMELHKQQEHRDRAKDAKR